VGADHRPAQAHPDRGPRPDLDRGWLLMADVGEPLRVLGNPPEGWLENVTTFTKLQIDETGHADEHRVVT
jgi:hypothetical protein